STSYALALHDALPISRRGSRRGEQDRPPGRSSRSRGGLTRLARQTAGRRGVGRAQIERLRRGGRRIGGQGEGRQRLGRGSGQGRSEEHTSELQSRENL